MLDETFTIGRQVEYDSFLVIFLVERVGPFLKQSVDHFKTKLLVFVQPCMEQGSLHVFVWEVYYLLGGRQFQYLPYPLHVPLSLNPYLVLIASFSYWALTARGSYMSD